MTRAITWLFRIFVALIVLIGVGIGLAYLFFARSIPDYNAEWQVPGVTAPVEIVRDTHNVPHIFGQTDKDVYFGLGFAHAQDRLWQMMFLRRTVQGKLSELFGERTVQFDDALRRFDLYRLAQESLAVQDLETLAALKAYSAGVNAWLDVVNTRALGRGAPEFWWFSPEIAPWRPEDSLAIVKLMAVQLSSHVESEVKRARASILLGDERLRDILPDAPGDAVMSLPEYASLFPNAPRRVAQIKPPRALDPMSPMKPAPFGGASNAWAAAPSRSAAGGTLLANDPHLEFTAPVIWYLSRLELESGGVIGAGIPGIPAVMTGRSAELGWGITSAYVDNQDIFIEQLNPENPEEYLTPSGFKPFETRKSVIQVKDRGPVTITLRWSDNGPVLPGTHYDLDTITPPGHVAAIGWTALSASDTSLSAALKVMQSKTVGQALEAAERFVSPAQNLTIVDRERIALKVVGAMPRRAAAHQSQGRIPSPGWRPQNRWQGVLGYSANPETIDPEGGLVGNTNNKTSDRPFPLHVSYDWGDSQRVQRWTKLMTARRVHTRESFIEAQLDTVSNSATVLLPLVGGEFWYNQEAAEAGTPQRQRQIALGLLAEWNGEMNEHLPEPLIYAAWMRALQDRLIRDELGPFADHFTHVEPLFIERVFRDVDGAGVWCDVVQSAATETCDEAASRALDDALISLSEVYGPRIEAWRWGDAHEATHVHPVLKDVRGLSAIVNIRQSTSGGDQTLMRGLTRGSAPNPYENTHGSGYRGVYDFADPDSSVFIIATGQSGHPLSRHYDDLGELWRRGEYIPMTLDPELARAGATGVTRLLPDDSR